MKRTTVKMKGKPCCPQPPVSIQILNGGILAPSGNPNSEDGVLLKENDEFILLESGDNIELE